MSSIIGAMQQALRTGSGNGHGAPRDPRLLEGVLSNVALFRGVAQRQMADLAARSRALQYRRGTTICALGQCQSGLFAIAYGQVKLAFRGADGEERVLRIVGAAETFGLAVALLGRPLPFEAVALEETFLVMVPATAVFALAENDPRFMRAVIGVLAERTLTLLAEVEAGSLRRGVQRLASYLDSIALPNGSDGTYTARLPTTKTVVASRLGVKKETLSRLLRDLVQQGLIAVEQREIAILDRLALAAIAREPTAVLQGAPFGRALAGAASMG